MARPPEPLRCLAHDQPRRKRTHTPCTRGCGGGLFGVVGEIGLPAGRSQRLSLHGAFDRQARGWPSQVLPRPGGGACRRGPEHQWRRRGVLRGRRRSARSVARHGGGSARLSGGVDGDALRRALDGLDPRDGLPLRESLSPVRVAGFDLTFSAPKSVSVVFALGDWSVRGAVRDAHDRAAREAFAYLEGSAAAVRRGHGGARVEPASGLVSASHVARG